MRTKTGLSALHQQHAKAHSRLRARNPKLADELSNFDMGWYKLRIRNQDEDGDGEEEEIADLYIYDDIMPAYMAEWFGGVSAEGLINQLNEITAKTINVRINSPGGAVFEAIAIYNALVSHSATINVYVDALAASAASIVAMAGDKITMMVGSQMMIHDALGVSVGNAAETREFADFLDRQSDNIASIYANRSGVDAKEMRDLMLAETWMFPEEAVELGLADEVYTKPKNAEGDEEEESEEDTPPEKEGEEAPNETPPGQEEEEEEKPDEEKEAENLLSRRHSLANRGFKYTGRKRAPNPVDSLDSDVDNVVNAWKKLETV